ncbi:hypothetical protein CHS0354_006448 [Potamilus streckersoni]|uniref:Uncharacterized protein n=1 Tax=Potamilus streckersoni TaxID=2493646 RepID=A0AAE0T9W2_9BIVA|nr:hypothetical protein CHS0354_006448 [Potamilus streckersoni]
MKRKAQDTQQPKTDEDQFNDVESAKARILNKETQTKNHPQSTDPNKIPYKKPKNITIDRIQLGAFDTNPEPPTNQPCYNRLDKINHTVTDSQLNHQRITIGILTNTLETPDIQASQQIQNNQSEQLFRRPKHAHTSHTNRTEQYKSSKRKTQETNIDFNCNIARNTELENNHDTTYDTPYKIDSSCITIQHTQKSKNHSNITDAHPRYLTLYLRYPTKTHTQPTDSAIIMELIKHKQGQVQIKHIKTSGNTIRCFTGAHIKAYKKVKKIDNIPVNIYNHHTYSKLNETKNKELQVNTKITKPKNN